MSILDHHNLIQWFPQSLYHSGSDLIQGALSGRLDKQPKIWDIARKRKYKTLRQIIAFIVIRFRFTTDRLLFGTNPLTVVVIIRNFFGMSVIFVSYITTQLIPISYGSKHYMLI